MARILWTPVAELDLEEILYYIAVVDQNVEGADRVYDGINLCIASAADGKATLHKHPQAPADWRYVKHKRWLIFLKPVTGAVEIMRVVDGVRDLPTLLRGN